MDILCRAAQKTTASLCPFYQSCAARGSAVLHTLTLLWIPAWKPHQNHAQELRTLNVQPWGNFKSCVYKRRSQSNGVSQHATRAPGWLVIVRYIIRMAILLFFRKAVCSDSVNGAQSQPEFRVREEQTWDLQEAKETRHVRTNLKWQPSSDLQTATPSQDFLDIFFLTHLS